jgi:hypothetical protein
MSIGTLVAGPPPKIGRQEMQLIPVPMAARIGNAGELYHMPRWLS